MPTNLQQTSSAAITCFGSSYFGCCTLYNPPVNSPHRLTINDFKIAMKVLGEQRCDRLTIMGDLIMSEQIGTVKLPRTLISPHFRNLLTAINSLML